MEGGRRGRYGGHEEGEEGRNGVGQGGRKNRVGGWKRYTLPYFPEIVAVSLRPSAVATEAVGHMETNLGAGRGRRGGAKTPTRALRLTAAMVSGFVDVHGRSLKEPYLQHPAVQESLRRELSREGGLLPCGESANEEGKQNWNAILED